MFRKALLPVLAVVGLLWAIYTVRVGSRQPPAADPAALPAQAPYASYVAGAGIVEALSENISIGSLVPGIVTRVYVQFGDTVKAGDPLFQIDDRDMRADLLTRQASLQSAQAKLKRMQSMPRPEDIPPARAAVELAQAELADAQTQYDLYLRVSDKGAIVQDDLNKRKYAVAQSAARLAQARSTLDELLAGAWKEDLLVAQADVASAQAAVDADQLMLSRFAVKAPIAGQLLQVKIHPGEYAPAAISDQPLMLLGSVDRLVVRTDVDENDAWRVDPSAPAVAFLRGNRDIRVNLTFYRLEPYVIPKKSLTGDTTERVDTRVLQVLYTFDRASLPIYAGQQMDVYINAEKPSTRPTESP